jgi:hypothetical protein
MALIAAIFIIVTKTENMTKKGKLVILNLIGPLLALFYNYA